MRLRYDWPLDGDPPGPGDTLVCMRQRDRAPTGNAYLILAARPVRTRDGSRAMRYDVEPALETT